MSAYALAKAQRLMHGIDAGIGPIVVNGAVEPINALYRTASMQLPQTLAAGDADKADLALTGPPAGRARRGLDRGPSRAAVLPPLEWCSIEQVAAILGIRLASGAFALASTKLWICARQLRQRTQPERPPTRLEVG